MVSLALLLTACGEAGQRSTVDGSSKSEGSRHRRSGAAPITRRSSEARATFRFEAVTLSPALRGLISHTSWHPGCPVSLKQLRYLRISYRGFDHRAHLGEMVVNASAVAHLRRAFAALFAARFAIRRMRLVDRYGGDDYASIQADNTSSFNCRDATGSSRWSEHAYGVAIDINPIENPYVYANGTTTHRASGSLPQPLERPPGNGSPRRDPRAGVRRDRLGLGRPVAAADRLSALLRQRPIVATREIMIRS